MPYSSPVTIAVRPTLLPVTGLPFMVSTIEILRGDFFASSPQYPCVCSALTYSPPVTRLHVPGSLPVTLPARPIRLPLIALPCDVVVTVTFFAVVAFASLWQNLLKMSAPRYSVPVTVRQVLGSSPVMPA